MTANEPRDHFDSATAGLDRSMWRWVGAIALEQAVGRSVLSRLGAQGKHADERLDRWLGGAVAAGLLVATTPGRAQSLGPAPAREPGFAVHPSYEQLVLRKLAASNELDAIAKETQALLGRRSVSEIACALQRGDLESFARHHAAARLQRTVALRTASQELLASLCAPFDARFLTRTWGAEAERIALIALRDALDGPTRCDGLEAWVRSKLETSTQASFQSNAASLLCEHAIVRGDHAAIFYLAGPLPAYTRVGFAAAAHFVEGDEAKTRAALELCTRGGLPACGAVSPILALLLRGSGTKEGAALAKRVIARSTTDGERGTARALRQLFRYLDQPRGPYRRIDYHQLPADSGAWPVLLSGFTVDLHLDQPTTRAVWAQSIARRAAEIQAAGYTWLASQAALLAERLDADLASTELSRSGLQSRVMKPASSLWDVLQPKPEWRRALEALASISLEEEVVAEGSRRAIWYVDMVDGDLERPAMQEYRAAGGWSQGTRMSFAQLWETRDALPPEDRSILDHTRDNGQRDREPTPEVFEALIGHPRVVNGVRGMSVEVVAGVCRIETEEEDARIHVRVKPEGAELGVNVALEGEARIVVYRVTTAMWRVIEAMPKGTTVPKSEQAALLRVLEQLARRVEVRSAQLGADRDVDPDATPCVRFVPHAGAWLVQVGVRPFGDKGRFYVAGTGNPSLTLHADGQHLLCARDLARERSNVDALVAACPTLAAPSQNDDDPKPVLEADSWVFDEESVLSLLSELREMGAPHHLEWPESSALQLRGRVDAKNLHCRLRSDKGWYLATGGVRLDAVTDIALGDLARAPWTPSGRFLRLPNGDYLEVARRVRRVVAALGAVASGKRGASLRIHPGAVPALRELADPDLGFDVNRDAASWLARVDELASDAFPVPEGLRADLRPYQIDGYRWLCRLATLGLGACLADDMGLGKTVQIIALLLRRSEEGPALVVAPTSVCSNWISEIERFAPSLAAVEYSSSDRAEVIANMAERGPGRVIVCSYGILQQDVSALAAIVWGTVVLDEAQFIKNAESMRARAAYELKAKQRIAATGTPVENHFGDLWSVFRFLNPGLLGEWADFKRRYVLPVERDGSFAPGAVLREVARPYLLRRTKKDVLTELPPVTEVHHEVRLSEDDELRYALLRKQIHEKLFTFHGKRDNKLEVLAEITRLRRFCCHPRLVFPDAENDSAKIRTFLDLAEELRENGHRALVFSQYVDFLVFVREALDERGIHYEYLDGSTPKAQRKERVDAFQSGDSTLFLISLKAGGFGLNLTAADYVIHLDPWWNPAVESQATDRAHRIGQTRPVTVYRLVTKNTIEEKIVRLHEKKRRLARAVLDTTDDAQDLGTDELVALLGPQ
ncbi:MAG: DEAD/DEAH box helicase [Polyangiaceae bacterium]|nr:DEAD/DEAH box helicase [Polyangiaceae bacterium]